MSALSVETLRGFDTKLLEPIFHFLIHPLVEKFQSEKDEENGPAEETQEVTSFETDFSNKKKHTFLLVLLGTPVSIVAQYLVKSQ